jgi:large subunit ribosomal protein L9
MEIILKRDVEKLGYKDDLVEVKDGYGRNFLIPQGHAILATASAKKVHAETVRQRAQKVEKERAAAQKMADKLKETSISVGAKVGESGKIFGSVNNIQLAEEFSKLGFNVDRKHIKIIGDTIKSIGTYEAEVAFHRDVVETISFEVVGE